MSVKRTVARVRSSSASSWRTEAMNRSIEAMPLTVASELGEDVVGDVDGHTCASGIMPACTRAPSLVGRVIREKNKPWGHETARRNRAHIGPETTCDRRL